MSDLPDVEKKVKVLKSILSEGVDLASEKRRFQGFLQDYPGRPRIEQSLNLERKHLNVLVLRMRYRRFDAVVKGRGDAAGLNGLGDWLARQKATTRGCVNGLRRCGRSHWDWPRTLSWIQRPIAVVRRQRIVAKGMSVRAGVVLRSRRGVGKRRHGVKLSLSKLDP